MKNQEEKEKMNLDRNRRLKLRMNNQFHRGGEVEKMHPGIEIYVHSKRNGKLIRDREKTVDQLVIVLNRIENLLKNNESVIIVGTTSERGRLLERVYADVDSSKRIRVTRTWVSGIRTNYTNFQNYVLRFKATNEERKSHAEKRWYELNRKGREGMVGISDSNEKVEQKKERPGLIVFRNPNDHVVGRKEALRCGIPTVGRVDTDCKYSERLTYPVPGNDDSRGSQRTMIRRIKRVYEESQKKEGK